MKHKCNHKKDIFDCDCYMEGKEEGYKLGLQQKALASEKVGYNKAIEGVNGIIKWLGEIVWCNAHDSAWIEETITKLQSLNQEEKKE